MKTILVAAALMLTACSPKPTNTMALQTSDRFRVERVGVIADTLAYNDRRGIYIIKDTQTGQEFVGVSGVGISTLGQHSCGKSCIATDER